MDDKISERELSIGGGVNPSTGEPWMNGQDMDSGGMWDADNQLVDGAAITTHDEVLQTEANSPPKET